MSVDPRAAFEATSDAAQRIAGVIAARSRGDLIGAEALLASMDDRTRAAGALLLADLAVSLYAHGQDRPVVDVAGELSLDLAALGDR